MGHYKSNLRDLEFNLFEVFCVQDRMGTGPYAAMDRDTAHEVLVEVERLSTGVLADSFVDADRRPPTFDPETHSVTMPDSFKKAFRALWDGGWYRLELLQELGGFGSPPSLRWAASEMIAGANSAAFLYMGGPSFAQVVYLNGTAEQRRWATMMIEKGWGGTMVLTEPDAGSDVGAGRVRATAQADGTWHIHGVKRFITSGDHDLADNIMHLVLARPDGAGPGTKGLSLFLVPKYHFDSQTGERAERNGVFVTGVEHKMGLKASATCELTFGQHGVPAVGWLLGDLHDGIAQMFQVIEYARMMVGTKAIGTLSTGYLNALSYAKARVQGVDITQVKQKAAPRVTIIQHPDVRRMLMLQKAYAEGMRALYLYTASFQDQVAAGEGDVELAGRMNALLLPVVKGVGSERASEMLNLSLQTFGGSGFLQDYPIEQYLRDAKIDSLYEGTTGIQAQDFFFRKVVLDGGQAFAHLERDIQKFIECSTGERPLDEERALLAQALADIQGMLSALIGYLNRAPEDRCQIYKVAQQAVRFLMSTGDLLIGWLLLRQAEIASNALTGGTSEADTNFYEGKIGAARFFTRTVLPELSARRAIVEACDNSLMDLSEDAF